METSNFLTCRKENRPVQEIEFENKSLIDAEEKQTVALAVVENSMRIEKKFLIVDGLESSANC